MAKKYCTVCKKEIERTLIVCDNGCGTIFCSKICAENDSEKTHNSSCGK